MKGELESQQELFLQGIDLFGSQVLVPTCSGWLKPGYAPGCNHGQRGGGFDHAAGRGRELEPGPCHLEGADSGKQHSPNRSGIADPAALWPTCAAN